MYSNFKYETLPLKDIVLDERNPRLVTQKKLTSQDEIVRYLMEHDDLMAFIKKIATEGKNHGAERPYVVKTASEYTVVEGNTRIAAYKLLTGLLPFPKDHGSAPKISQALKKSLVAVDCSIAPNRDALLPIMASAHFGLGDKSKWGYLGSRKAVFDEWKAGKSIAQLAKAFDRTKGQISDLILEYQLYLKAIGFKWTKEEKDVLLDPSVEFNPPVRFLQSQGHKASIGISYDKVNLKILTNGPDAEKQFKHLVHKLVVSPQQGLGATAAYADVFEDYATKQSNGKSSSSADPASADASGESAASDGTKTAGEATDKPGVVLKAGALFAYNVTMSNNLVVQLMKEAKGLNCKTYPAAGTFLLRNIVEAILKHIIDQQKANAASKLLDLEGALNLCMSNHVSLLVDDKKVLKEFLKTHLSYLNLGSHGTIIPNHGRVTCAAPVTR